MGDPRKRHKKYSKPRKLFDKARIEEENALIKKYGLKNKREIWKIESMLEKLRNQAKSLIVASPEQQKKFFDRLIKMGLIKKNPTIDEVLALTKEKLLDRRLQTVVFSKNLAKTIKEARQLIVHRKVIVNDRIIDSPSYLVKADEEDKISIKTKKIKTSQSESVLPQDIMSQAASQQLIEKQSIEEQ